MNNDKTKNTLNSEKIPKNSISTTQADSQTIINNTNDIKLKESDPFPELPDIVDIGGEVYSFSRLRKNPVKMHLRTYEEFIQNYNLKSQPKLSKLDAEQVVRTYLPYGVVKDIATYIEMDEESRRKIVKLLETRSSKLKEAIKTKRNANQFYLRNYRDQVSADEIDKLLHFFKQFSSQLPTSQLAKPSLQIPEIPGYKFIKIQTSQQAATTKKKLLSLSEDEKTEHILRLAFYMLHPDKLDKSILTEWQTILDWAKKAGPTDFIQQIRQAAKESQTKAKLESLPIPTEPPSKTLNWLSRMNYSKIQAATNQNSAKIAIKDSLIRLESVEEQQRTRAMNSLRRVLMVLAQKKYISEENSIKAGSDGNFTSEMEQLLQKTLKEKLSLNLKPLFETFENLYSDYYNSILEFLRTKVKLLKNDDDPNSIFETFIKLHTFLENVQINAGTQGYPITPAALYKLNTDSFSQEFHNFMTELFQIMTTMPQFPVKQLTYEDYFSLSNKNMLGFGAQPSIPRQTVTSAMKMKDFLGIEPVSEPIFLFPRIGDQGNAITIFYSLLWESEIPQIEEFVTIHRSFAQLFMENKREKMINVESMRVIILAMYQVLLENEPERQPVATSDQSTE